MNDNPNMSQFLDRLQKLSDETRTEAKNKRHKLGLRTARENLDHLVEGIKLGNASAVLAASIFHYGNYSILEAKQYLESKGIPVRI